MQETIQMKVKMLLLNNQLKKTNKQHLSPVKISNTATKNRTHTHTLTHNNFCAMENLQDNTNTKGAITEQGQKSSVLLPISENPQKQSMKLRSMKTKHFSREGSFSSLNSSPSCQNSSILHLSMNPFNLSEKKTDQMDSKVLNKTQQGLDICNQKQPNDSKQPIQKIVSTEKVKEFKLKITQVSLPMSITNNLNENYPKNSNTKDIFRESLSKQFSQASTGNQYYLQSNGESIRKKRLLSISYEESGQFMELVTFIDNATKTEELSQHKLIRKNSCSCRNCGTKTSKQKRVDRCLPQFKSKQAVRLMYRHAFQKTIGDISKINKFFKSKLKIGNNYSVTRDFNPGNSKQDAIATAAATLVGTKSSLSSPSQPQPLKLLSNIPLGQNNQDNASDGVNQKAKTPKAKLFFKTAKTPTSRNNQKNESYSRGSNNLSGHSPTSSASRSKGRNNPQTVGDQHKLFLAKIKQQLRPKSEDIAEDQPKKLIGSQGLITTNNNVCFSSEAQSVSLSQTTINISSINSNNTNSANANPINAAGKGMRLDQLLLSNQGKLNQGQKDKIIDQFKQETKLGKCNNDFVISLGSQVVNQANQKQQQQILKQKSSASTSFQRQKTLIARQKSKQSIDFPILETYEEDHLQQLHCMTDNDKTQTKHIKVMSQYFRNIPKISNRFFCPVLADFNRESSTELHSKTATATLNSFLKQPPFIEKQKLSRQGSIEIKGGKFEGVESQMFLKKIPKKAFSYQQLPTTQHFQEKEQIVFTREGSISKNTNKMLPGNKAQQQGSPGRILFFKDQMQKQQSNLMSIHSLDLARLDKKRKNMFKQTKIGNKSEKSLIFESKSPLNLCKGYRRYNTQLENCNPMRNTCNSETDRKISPFCSLDVYLRHSKYSSNKWHKSQVL